MEKPKPTDPKMAFNVVDVAHHTSVSPRTVEAMIVSGKIPAPTRIGRRRIWPRATIEKWIGLGCPDRSAWDAIEAAERNVAAHGSR